MSKERKALDDFIKDYLFLCEKLYTNKQEKMLLDGNSPYNVLKTYLESIDNAEPSEALKCLEKVYSRLPQWDLSRNIDQCNTIKQALLKAQEPKKYVDELKLVEKERKALDLLMQELDCKDFADLRKYARCGYERLNNFKDSKEVKIEIPESSLMDYNPVKKYLKWEDFIFKHTPKTIDVKMGDNKYTLVVGFNVAGKNLAILRDGKKEYYFLECDKQFFNDLHLERVE